MVFFRAKSLVRMRTSLGRTAKLTCYPTPSIVFVNVHGTILIPYSSLFHFLWPYTSNFCELSTSIYTSHLYAIEYRYHQYTVLMCVVIFIPLITFILSHETTDVALCQSFALLAITLFSPNLIPRSPLLAIMTVYASFPPITAPAAVVDCGTPPTAHVNGNQPVYSSTTFESTVTYTCQPGYMRIGDRTITCLADGQWSASAPVCNRELTLQQ